MIEVVKPWLSYLLEADSPAQVGVLLASIYLEEDGEALYFPQNQGWVERDAVVSFINEYLGTSYTQKQIFMACSVFKKVEEYLPLFPTDPHYLRNSTWCYVTEAWLTILIMFTREGRSAEWLGTIRIVSSFLPSLTVEYV